MPALPGHTSKQGTGNKPKNHLTEKPPYKSANFRFLRCGRSQFGIAGILDFASARLEDRLAESRQIAHRIGASALNEVGRGQCCFIRRSPDWRREGAATRPFQRARPVPAPAIRTQIAHGFDATNREYSVPMMAHLPARYVPVFAKGCMDAMLQGGPVRIQGAVDREDGQQELCRAAFVRLSIDAKRPQRLALGAFNCRVAERRA
jgi:hypothetical protein